MKTTMAHVWILCSCFFAVLVPQTSAQSRPVPAPPLGTVERYFYEQLDNALSNDGATLEQLREVLFRQQRSIKIQFHVDITADSIANSNCSVCQSWWLPRSQCEPAFCRRVHEKVSRYGNISTAYDQWKLCSNLSITWITHANVDEFIEVLLANTVVPWCAHGPSFLIVTGLITNALLTKGYIGALYFEEVYTFDNEDVVKIHLLLKDLECQPYAFQLINAVGQFFTWVRIITASEYMQ